MVARELIWRAIVGKSYIEEVRKQCTNEQKKKEVKMEENYGKLMRFSEE